MERRTFITSSSNPRLKKIRRLRRRGDGAFFVEGFRQVACALEAGLRVRQLVLAPELWLGSSEAALARADVEVLRLSAAAFRSISGNVRPDGVAAVVERPPTGLERLRLESDPLILVAEAVEKPGNLGTLVRSACAAGADALVLGDGRSDPFHPETVRGSVGTLFKLPLAAATSAQAVTWLQQQRIRIVVATPEGDTPAWDADLTGPTALVVGNERYGVTRTWLDNSDTTICVPMPGPADSLNVAVAAGVVLFEAARQRALSGAIC